MSSAASCSPIRRLALQDELDTVAAWAPVPPAIKFQGTVGGDGIDPHARLIDPEVLEVGRDLPRANPDVGRIPGRPRSIDHVPVPNYQIVWSGSGGKQQNRH